MKLLATALLIGLPWCDAHAQKPELRWGEFGYYSNWDRYSYAIKSSYEFIGKLPDLRDFPRLLEMSLAPTHQNDRAVIISQMRALSRCDFEKRSLDQGDDPEAEYRTAVTKWKDWWNTYGSKLAESLSNDGRRYENAWKAVAPAGLECPEYPLSIPAAWSSTLSFHSGDYQSRVEEIIDFQISVDRCELRRRYRTGWLEQSKWIHETWEGFSRDEADHFLAALLYAIDNPWFFSADKLENIGSNGKIIEGSIRGRPKPWSTYYPSCQWTGILDQEGHVIINCDPWCWHSVDPNLGKETRLDGGAFGVVFRVVRNFFPDPSWIPSKSHWKKVDPPDDNRQNKAE